MAYTQDIECGKKESETPLEYLNNLPELLLNLREDIANLTQLVLQTEYTELQPQENTLDILRHFWERFEIERGKVLI